jgi:RNA polymerase sigma-70 factor (ECF subfamily)
VTVAPTPTTDADAALRAAAGRGRAAWPDLAIDEAALEAHLRRLLPGDDRATIERLAAEDLALAFACARGDQRALDAFDARYRAELRTIHRRGGDLGIDADDFRQLVYQRIFVRRDGAPPRIDGFTGRGNLLTWLRTTAVRLLLNLRAARPHATVPLEGRPALEPVAAVDVELAHLRELYRDRFAAAVERAFAGLTPRARNLLRQRFVHGLGQDQLAALHGVHRATVGRWLLAAQDELAAAVKAELTRGLAIDSAEYASLVRLVGGTLHLSLDRLLPPPSVEG